MNATKNEIMKKSNAMMKSNVIKNEMKNDPLWSFFYSFYDRLEQDIMESIKMSQFENRSSHIAQMKREKERQRKLRQRIRRIIPVICIILLAITAVTILIVRNLQKKDHINERTEITGTDSFVEIQTEELQETLQQEEENNAAVIKPETTEKTAAVSDEIISTNVVLVDPNKHTVIAQRDAMEKMNPASMTKVLTILVASKAIDNLKDTYTITAEETDFSFANDCSNVGYEKGETVSVKDLFYGTILSSGADAAVGLANYTAGSVDEFVKLMNQELEKLGLSDTAHMTNCVGIYDKEHYCTAYDMAVIMEAALEDEFCREVLSAHTYTTSKTTSHPDGITISNWFLRRIEDKDAGGTVLCGKTGYVVQSGNCAVSYAYDAEGNELICVTGNSTSGWRCIYDHVALYKKFFTK